jgi:hypothetical protein
VPQPQEIEEALLADFEGTSHSMGPDTLKNAAGFVVGGVDQGGEGAGGQGSKGSRTFQSVEKVACGRCCS